MNRFGEFYPASVNIDLMDVYNPHYSRALLLQTPIRCCDEPSAGGLAPRALDVLFWGLAPSSATVPVPVRTGTDTPADARKGVSPRPPRAKTRPAHQLAGVRKHGSTYSSSRGPRDAAPRFRDEPS
jgi:hypothetical protein